MGADNRKQKLSQPKKGARGWKKLSKKRGGMGEKKKKKRHISSRNLSFI